MKFALSTLSTAVLTVTLMGLTTSALASANENNTGAQNEVTSVTVTQVVDADDQSLAQDASTTNNITPANTEQQRKLTPLIDPITRT